VRVVIDWGSFLLLLCLAVQGLSLCDRPSQRPLQSLVVTKGERERGRERERERLEREREREREGGCCCVDCKWIVCSQTRNM
jgi:hypothetical protein